MERSAEAALAEFTRQAEEEIAKEKAEREATQKELFQLWEQTCQKIQDTKNFWLLLVLSHVTTSPHQLTVSF